MEIFQQYLISLGWGLTGAITMAISLSLLIVVFNKLTPIDEWSEIKKGNIGVALILAALIIGFAIVVGLSIVPGVA